MRWPASPNVRRSLLLIVAAAGGAPICGSLTLPQHSAISPCKEVTEVERLHSEMIAE